jgi:hypothetical protein
MNRFRLNADTTRKVIASARLLESDKPGEVIAAVNAMGRLLPDGVGVADLFERSLATVPPSPQTYAQPRHDVSGWKSRARMARLSPYLNDWERGFLADVIAWSSLSARQEATLKAIIIKSEGQSR